MHLYQNPESAHFEFLSELRALLLSFPCFTPEEVRHKITALSGLGRRALHVRLKQCGFDRVSNIGAATGRWSVGPLIRTLYADSELPEFERQTRAGQWIVDHRG